jgi:RND family efflux transporter MFP subunit
MWSTEAKPGWFFSPPGSRLLAIALAFTACHRDPTPAASDEVRPPVAVTLAQVELKTRVAVEEVAGTVRSKSRATIEAKIPGRIEQVRVAPGQSVEAGDLLLELDRREIQSRLDQALPVLRNTEAEVKRFQSLLKQSAVSQSEFEAVEARYRVAQAAVTEAETMLSYAQVAAPFAGVITRKLADVGDLAFPGRALLELEDPRSLRVEIDVPESLIERVSLGAQLTLRTGSSAAGINGIVSEIAPAADPVTRTFLVKLDVPESAGLRAGQFARVGIPLDASPAVHVPAGAVVQRGQLELVFVVVNGRAQLRLVKTGKRLGDEREIVSGLAVGERVVVGSKVPLRDGDALEVQP